MKPLNINKAKRLLRPRLLSGIGTFLSLASLVLSRPVQAQSYAIHEIPSFGGDTSMAFAINAAGQVVGKADVSGANAHAFQWGWNGFTYVMADLTPGYTYPGFAYGINTTGMIVGDMPVGSGNFWAFYATGGVLHQIGAFGGVGSIAYGVNDNGLVVGKAPAVQSSHAFVYNTNTGAFTDLTPQIGNTNSEALAINNAGQIVGWAYGSGAFLYQNGQMTVLPKLPVGGMTTAHAINENGEIAGEQFSPTSSYSAVLWRNGSILDLGTLGGSESDAFGINNLGQVVGWSKVTTEPYDLSHAFLWTPYGSGGVMTDLNNFLPPNSGWKLYSARAINDKGQIVGQGGYNGKYRGFRLTPLRPDSLTFSPAIVDEGVSTTGTVTLLDEATASGVWVSLVSGVPNVVTVPAQVFVPAGQRSATFPVQTGAVTTTTPVVIMATGNGGSASATVTVQPTGIQSVSAGEMYISGVKWVVFKATLAPSKDDILVMASSSNPAALAFNSGATTSKWVWAGSTQAVFFLKPQPGQTPTPVTLTATANGKSKSLTYTVQP